MKKSSFLSLSLLISASNVFSAQIAEHAISNITPKGYPKLYAIYGDAGFAKINKLAPLAAKKAAQSPECDKVEIVEISGTRSTPSNIIFFADCTNGKRFYINETEIASGGAAQSQTAKMSTYSNDQAIANCENSIKKQLKNPLTYDRKATTTSVYRAPTTGNIVVTFVFTAKNDLGGELPQKAKCVITEKGIEDVLLLAR